MAIKKKKYILFNSLVKKFEEQQIVSTFYIIYHEIIKNSLTEIEILFYLETLFKNNLNLFLINNIKDGINSIKKNNISIYKYLLNKYKQQKYENYFYELFKLFENCNGTISKLLNNINDMKYMFDNKIILQNNINKINRIIDSFDDKKFIFSINNFNNFSKVNIDNIKIINSNEIINRLFCLINTFGINPLKKINIDIINIKEFNQFNYINKIKYYQNCIEKISQFSIKLKNNFCLYLDSISQINFVKNLFNLKYNKVINYSVINIVDSIITNIENEKN